MLDYIKTFFFVTICFFLTRQVPFMKYSYIMNITLLLFVFLEIKNIFSRKGMKLGILVFNLLLILLMAVYSFMLGNEINLIFRFFVILIFLVLAFYIEPKEKYIKYFFGLILIQCLFLIFFEVYLILKANPLDYSNLRNFYKGRGWGDVYTFGNNIWKIQLKGNALLPFAFFLGYYYFEKRKNILLGMILAANFIAGNFAYTIGIIFFIVLDRFFIKKNTISSIVKYILLIAILITISFPKILKVYKLKKGVSNAIRIEQIEALTENLNETTASSILGKGLGNTFEKKKKFRTYGRSVYYELQIFYFLNQMGYLNFLIYFISHVLLVIIFFKKRETKVVYGSYIVYSLFNPYFLDTNHVIVIILLTSFENKGVKDNESRRSISNV